MSMYIVEKRLSSTTQEKMTSGVLALLLTSAFVLLLFFIKIIIPDPPYEIKHPPLEVDLEVPTMINMSDAASAGGGSGNPEVAQGNHGGGGNPGPEGGVGKIVTTNDQTSDNLPDIDPPTRDGTNSALKDRIKGLGDRKGKPGDPNSKSQTGGDWKGSNPTGTGSGPGTWKGPGSGGGNGLYSYNFTNYNMSSTLRTINADGVGIIVCRVLVDCDGHWSVENYQDRGSTYTGTAVGARNVVSAFLRSATFQRTGDKCPESGLISIEIKNKI